MVRAKRSWHPVVAIGTNRNRRKRLGRRGVRFTKAPPSSARWHRRRSPRRTTEPTLGHSRRRSARCRTTAAMPTRAARSRCASRVAWRETGRGGPSEVVPPLKAQSGGTGRGDGAPLLAVGGPLAVRRLTPRECERLQGMPDDYTLIPYRGKPAADGPRYRAIGNSMAVPVMRWIGRRIQMVDSIGG